MWSDFSVFGPLFGPPILSTQSGRCKICVPKHGKTCSKLIFLIKNTRRKRMFQYAFPLRKTEPKIVTDRLHTTYYYIGRTWIFKALLHNSPFGAITYLCNRDVFENTFSQGLENIWMKVIFHCFLARKLLTNMLL